jgi:DNA-binding transcriptional regulator YiaG
MRKFYSEACEVIYQDAVANFEIGAISEAELKEFEKDCFIEEDETPREKSLVTEHESSA